MANAGSSGPTPEERLQKELLEARAQIRNLQRRNNLITSQFAFYVQYGQRVLNDPEARVDFDEALNVGSGNAHQRLSATLTMAIDHPNPVTRHECREIIVRKLEEPCTPSDTV